MTDSVAVFSPGWRLLDASGDPVSGGVIRFYDAGTSTPKTVYSDAALSTSLGTSVTTDSGGHPTSDGSTGSMVYVGTAAYKVTFEDANGATVAPSQDNLKGAVAELSAADFSVTADFPVVTKSLDYTILEADQLTHFQTNCSGGDVTYTLPSAVTVGTGWQVTIQHAGTANAAIIATVSSQTITLGATSYGTQYALAREGQEVTLRSNGGGWVVANAVGNPLLGGVIRVEDRVSSAPGSPVTGGYYIVSSAYSTFEQEDVIYYNGSAYIEITPAEDCGWVAWVADEDLYYQFRGTAWVSEIAARLASQSDMETATSTTTFVSPGIMHHHPGVAKFWGFVTVSGGTPTLQTSYNVTSITDSGAGNLTVTIGTDFSDANWACLAMTKGENATLIHLAGEYGAGTKTAGSVQLDSRRTDNTNADPQSWSFAGFGDHA